MESLSNESYQNTLKESVSSLEADIETLKEVNQEVYDSIQEELKGANRVWEKARVALLSIESKKVELLRSMKSPPYDILGVLFAVLFLMAGDLPEDCIEVNEKKEPLGLSWKACQVMLKKFDFCREGMLNMKRLIDEEKISFEKTEPVREYLDTPWFHVPSLKMKSMPVSQLAEAVVNIIRYFDIIREIRLKIEKALGKEEAEEGNQGHEYQERED